MAFRLQLHLNIFFNSHSITSITFCGLESTLTAYITFLCNNYNFLTLSRFATHFQLYPWLFRIMFNSLETFCAYGFLKRNHSSNLSLVWCLSNLRLTFRSPYSNFSNLGSHRVISRHCNLTYYFYSHWRSRLQTSFAKTRSVHDNAALGSGQFWIRHRQDHHNSP